MGLKVPDDLDYIIWGDDCPACTPGLFKPGHTPKFVWAIFFDIVACPGHVPPPNNKVFKLEQSIVNPCTWDGNEVYKGNRWRIQYNAFQGWMHLDHWADGPVFPYFESVRAQCAWYWNSNLRMCVNSGGTGGRAVMGNMDDSMLHSLTNDYHFVPRDRTYYERQDVGMDHVLVRLACRRFSSNVLIYLDEEDFDFIEYP